ncbi:MAG TPA: retropepsin-like aspartic protease [Rhizomicrobium sp.]|nr:retropepsin-like aspartic protease [Rhizomicrobium sp.]
MIARRIVLAALSLGLSSGAIAAPLSTPFDFSRTAIGLDVTVKGKPLTMILDTGVDPSVIDVADAEALGLKIDKGTSGEASGVGDAKEAKVYAATIDGLAIAGRNFPAIDALAMNMDALSASYGRKLDGVLGYSFLNDKIVLIDYGAKRLSILDRPADAMPAVGRCTKRWTIPLKGFPDDNIPAVPDFRFGAASGTISLDTGSNRGISLYQAALALPGVTTALKETGESTATGARGGTTVKTYTLNVPVGFGPFTLPAGQAVTVRKTPGSESRVANIGNETFAAMGLKMLLDYKSRMMTFYGACR